MFIYHLYAESQEEALKKTQKQHPTLVIGEAYLDPIWQNTKRWCVEVYGRDDEKQDARRIDAF